MAQIKSSSVTSTSAKLTYTMDDYTPYKSYTWYFGLNRYTSETGFSNVTQSTVTPANSVAKTFSGLTGGYSYEGYMSIQGGGSIQLEIYHKFLTTPNKPTITISSITSNSAKISCAASGGATGYYYEFSNGISGYLGLGETKTITGLSSGTEYTVEAYTYAYHLADDSIYKESSTTSKSFTTSTVSYKTTIKHYLEDVDKDGSFTLTATDSSQYLDEGTSYDVEDFARNYMNYSFSYAEYDGDEVDSFSPTSAATLKIYYVAQSYNLTLTAGLGVSSFKVKKGNNSAITVSSGSSTSIKYGWTVNITPVLKSGYIFSYWYANPNNGPIGTTSYDNPLEFSMPGYAYSIQGIGVEKPPEEYTVTIKHWCQDNLDFSDYVIDQKTSSTWTEGSSFSINQYKVTYTHYTLDHVTYQKDSGSEVSIGTTSSLSITSDTTINYYYNRKTYYLTMTSNSNMSNTYYINGQSFKTGTALPFLYQQKLTIEVVPNDGYLFGQWSTSPVITGVHGSGENNITFYMPGEAVTMSASMVKEAEVYTITVKHYFEAANSTDFETSSYYEDNVFNATENSTIILEDQAIERYGFAYSYGQYNNTTKTSVTVTGNMTLKLYYLRTRHSLTVNGDSGVASFKSNDQSYSLGSVLQYKHGQTVKILAVFKSGYMLSSWESEQVVLPNPPENPLVIEEFPTDNVQIYINSQEVPYEPWEWNSTEINAFNNRGPFSTLTATRWNAFLDWCNELIKKKGGTQINSKYYGTKGGPLYANSFNEITQCLNSVANIPVNILATKKTGDTIKGSYFIDLAQAMNNSII